MGTQLPLASATIRHVYMKEGNELDNWIQEGEAPMNQQQQDYYKAVIGDAQARVTVGRDMSEMDYGSGGKVFISVSLACDQSAGGISQAAMLAAQMADYYVVDHFQQMKARCLQLQLLKPAHTEGRPQY